MRRTSGLSGGGGGRGERKVTEVRPLQVEQQPYACGSVPTHYRFNLGWDYPTEHMPAVLFHYLAEKCCVWNNVAERGLQISTAAQKKKKNSDLLLLLTG